MLSRTLCYVCLCVILLFREKAGTMKILKESFQDLKMSDVKKLYSSTLISSSSGLGGLRVPIMWHVDEKSRHLEAFLYTYEAFSKIIIVIYTILPINNCIHKQILFISKSKICLFIFMFEYSVHVQIIFMYLLIHI